MVISILHISDLHRDRTSHLRNRPLLQSLVQDANRYSEGNAIRWPDLVIASGDIVQGVPPSLGDPDSEMQRQYEEAEAFLAELADAFVGGDRNRIVIIPGNHDVNYPRVLGVLEEVPMPEPRFARDLVRYTQDPGTCAFPKLCR